MRRWHNECNTCTHIIRWYSPARIETNMTMLCTNRINVRRTVRTNAFAQMIATRQQQWQHRINLAQFLIWDSRTQTSCVHSSALICAYIVQIDYRRIDSVNSRTQIRCGCSLGVTPESKIAVEFNGRLHERRIDATRSIVCRRSFVCSVGAIESINTALIDF